MTVRPTLGPAASRTRREGLLQEGLILGCQMNVNHCNGCLREGLNTARAPPGWTGNGEAAERKAAGPRYLNDLLRRQLCWTFDN